MTAPKCDTCGRFCKQDEAVTFEHDVHGKFSPDQETVCKSCMTRSDLERYFPEDVKDAKN